MGNCNNCAFYCHGNSKCYGNAIRDEMAVDVDPGRSCADWTFDGLKEWEREQVLLMTMETRASQGMYPTP